MRSVNPPEQLTGASEFNYSLIADRRAGNKLGSLLLGESMRRPLALLAAVGTLAAAGVSAKSLSAEQSPFKAQKNNALIARQDAQPMDFVGIATNEISDDHDLDQAEEVARDVSTMGGNTLKTFYVIEQGAQSPNADNLARLCIAEQAAHDNNLNLIVTFIGKHTKDIANPQAHNYVPQTPVDVTNFLNTVDQIMKNISSTTISKSGKVQTRGCVPDQKKFIFQMFNEVNSPGFNDQINPALYLQLLAGSYTHIKAKAEQLGDSALIIGGGFAANHDPVTFFQQMGQNKITAGITEQVADYWDFHPYPINKTNDPSLVETSLYSAIEPLNKQYFGDTPIIFGEDGVQTILTPAEVKSGYYDLKKLPKQPVDQATQALYYCHLFQTAANLPNVKGVLTFVYKDSGQDPWTSGVVDAAGVDKLSKPVLTRVYPLALSAQPITC